MNVGHDGERTWIFGPRGVWSATDAATDAVLSAKALSLKQDPWTTRGVFAIKPGGGGYLVNGEGHLLAFDAEGTVSPVDRRAYAIAVFDESRWAIATRESREVVIRVGLFGAEAVRLRSPRNIQKPEWPGLLFDSDPPYTRRKRFSENEGRLRLRTAGTSLALADSDAGLVAIWREGEMDWRAAFRVPVTDGSEIEAHPTEEGVVVRLRLADGRGALLDFDEAGTLRHSMETRRSDAIVWDGNAVVHLSDGALRRWTPGVDDSELIAVDRFNASEGGRPATLVRVDDGYIAAACGEVVIFDRQGGWSCREFAEPEGKADPMVVATKEHKRKKTDPHIQLDDRVDHAKWILKEGPAHLDLPLVNMGGPATGLKIEVGGPAHRSLFEPTRVIASSVGWESELVIELPGGRGEFEQELMAGVEIPDVPKAIARRKADAKAWRWEQIPDDAFLHLRIEGVAKKLGSGLLTIRVSVKDHGSQGSLLRGQNLIIAEPDSDLFLPPDAQVEGGPHGKS